MRLRSARRTGLLPVAALGAAVIAFCCGLPASASPRAAGTGRADAATATLTIAVSASRVASGGKVTVTGAVTEAGAPVAGTPVDVSSYDAISGGGDASVTTDASGDWSVAIKVTGDTTVTASATALPSNQATATITATARVTLTLAGSVARPWLADPVHVAVTPSGWAGSAVLQVRRAGSAAWRTAQDSGAVWGTRAGTFVVRAVAPGESGAFAQGVSAPVTVTVRNGKVPAWLRELNAYRRLNDAPPVAENPRWSYGDSLHVRYMEKTGDYSHAEDPKSKWYTALGAQAGESSDLMMGGADGINVWARAPYHALAELSKYATMAGFYADGLYSALWTGAVDSPLTPAQPAYQFPAGGTTTSLLTYWGSEAPDPLAGCPAAWRNRADNWESIGLPIVFGNQRAVSRPSATVTYPGTSLRVCVVNAGIYGNAVFIIPLLPLKTRHSYTVTVKYSGKLQSKWVFRTAASGG